MGGPRDHHTYEVRQRQILYGITYMWSLKEMIQVFTKQIDSNIENKLMAIEGERMVGGVGINMQLYIK